MSDNVRTKAVTDLHVYDLQDDLARCLGRRAARHGRSVEAEHREILIQALSTEPEPSFLELAADLRRRLEIRDHTPAETLQREGREGLMEEPAREP